jgi:hypothetical protein
MMTKKTLEETLKEKFGEDQVVIKKWKWTDEQSKQLKD